MGKKKEPELNYRLLCESCYESNKALLARYKELCRKSLQMISVNRKGFTLVEGYTETTQEMNKIIAEIANNFTRYRQYEELAEAQETQGS